MASEELAVSVVLPASGTGDRFSCQTPKQFAFLLDKPVFFHTVMAFYRFNWVQNIVIIVSAEYIDRVTAMVDCCKDKVNVVLGSNTRHRSIREGVQALLRVIQGDENDMLTASLDRNLYSASEMPQAFKYDFIKKAYEQRLGGHAFDPDCGSLLLISTTKYWF
ncbi:D-ribitol-5-phosphate cytidylyltransferase-like [Dreissena polymorpha]|uniref:D-ribitol-5-phosphate cytidylyltransferase-like n=1 Tax=Dreissena polymorpha TaxID=45954 RepID=UPI0022654C05|nr:D-ribitol-5-phosphate cytidylyltransferase-like [Dreissena polymorpha]